MERYLATTLFGLEKILLEELESLGATSVRKFNRAVGFNGDKPMFYRANYHLRLALRILKQLDSFPVRDEKDIYSGIREIAWEKTLDARKCLAVDTVLATGRFRHSGYISQLAKDAIVDRIRDLTGQRPSVNVKDPDLRIRLHLDDQACSVSLDGSGESLHKRGYRVQSWKAPLNEVLAAGMIALSGWTPSIPFVNPMCGSGTLAIEAGMVARGLPGGYFRDRFGFQRWSDYDPELFESIRRERYLEESRRIQITACDQAYPAIRATQDNLARAGLLDRVSVQRSSFEEWEPAFENALLMLNPPYGERLEEGDLQSLYNSIGSVLKHKYTGSEAWILSGNPQALKHVGLKPDRKVELLNGSIRCRFQHYSLYAGSKKDKPVD